MESQIAKRREIRRKKLLSNTDGRMKKIMGIYSADENIQESLSIDKTAPPLTNNSCPSSQINHDNSDHSQLISNDIQYEAHEGSSETCISSSGLVDPPSDKREHIQLFRQNSSEPEGWILNQSHTHVDASKRFEPDNQYIEPQYETRETAAEEVADCSHPMSNNSSSLTKLSSSQFIDDTEAIFGSNSYHSRPYLRSRNVVRSSSQEPAVEAHAATEAAGDNQDYISNFVSQHMSESTEDQTEKSESSLWNRIRFFLNICFGIFIRIALNWHQNYIDTILYPFVALQITLFGCRKALNKPLADPNSGGVNRMLMMALSLSGVNAQLLQSYNSAMRIVNTVIQDFTVYIFAFIVTHVLQNLYIDFYVVK